MLLTKVAHQSANFSPNSSCYFWNQESVFLQICITLQCHETYLFRTFSSKPLYALDKRSRSKCKFLDFRLLAWKLTKFLMSFFKPRVSFPLKFASPFSAMIHNSSEIFLLKHYLLWTKRAHHCTTFQTFECSNENSPSSSSHVWNHKVRDYSSLHHCLVTWKITPLYFLAQKQAMEVKFSDFWVVGWNFTKFLMSYLKSQNSFSLNFASLFSVMRDNSPILFSWHFIWFG